MNTLINYKWYELIDMIYSYLSAHIQVRFALSCKYIHSCLPKETLRIAKILSLMRPTNIVIKTFKYYCVSQKRSILITNKKILGYNGNDRTGRGHLYINKYHNGEGPIKILGTNCTIYLCDNFPLPESHLTLFAFISMYDLIMDDTSCSEMIRTIRDCPLLDCRSIIDIQHLAHLVK